MWGCTVYVWGWVYVASFPGLCQILSRSRGGLGTRLGCMCMVVWVGCEGIHCPIAAHITLITLSPPTCDSITTKLLSRHASRSAASKSLYSTSLKGTPRNTSFTRASNLLLSANVSLESVFSRRACTTSRYSTVESTVGNGRQGE